MSRSKKKKKDTTKVPKYRVNVLSAFVAAHESQLVPQLFDLQINLVIGFHRKLLTPFWLTYFNIHSCNAGISFLMEQMCQKLLWTLLCNIMLTRLCWEHHLGVHLQGDLYTLQQLLHIIISYLMVLFFSANLAVL